LAGFAILPCFATRLAVSCVISHRGQCFLRGQGFCVVHYA
jgi:hypothetical protein